MNISLTKVQGGYRADCTDLPGMPPCGDGKNKRMAIACLFYRMLFDNGTTWFQYIKRGEPIIIDGERWEPAKLTLR